MIALGHATERTAAIRIGQQCRGMAGAKSQVLARTGTDGSGRNAGYRQGKRRRGWNWQGVQGQAWNAANRIAKSCTDQDWDDRNGTFGIAADCTDRERCGWQSKGSAGMERQGWDRKESHGSVMECKGLAGRARSGGDRIGRDGQECRGLKRMVAMGKASDRSGGDRTAVAGMACLVANGSGKQRCD